MRNREATLSDPVAQFRAAVEAAIGASPDEIEHGRLHRFATNGKRSDTSGWCKLFDDGQAGVFGDFRTGENGFWRAASNERMTPAERALLLSQVAAAKAEREKQQAEAWRKARKSISDIWQQTRTVVPGDPVHRYLSNRMVERIANIPPCLRFHPRLPYVHEGSVIGRYPAMVAPVVGDDGGMRALHRTYLAADGRKADVPGPVKKLTPACALLSGGSIRLCEPRDGVLGIAEGIETALAASIGSGIPTAAAYSAGALERFVWPRGLLRLVIFADHDDAGKAAAQALRLRASGSGLEVRIEMPEAQGQDWADVLFQARTAGACA
jgi:putative DNA primase/helicase